MLHGWVSRMSPPQVWGCALFLAIAAVGQGGIAPASCPCPIPPCPCPSAYTAHVVQGSGTTNSQNGLGTVHKSDENLPRTESLHAKERHSQSGNPNSQNGNSNSQKGIPNSQNGNPNSLKGNPHSQGRNPHPVHKRAADDLVYNRIFKWGKRLFGGSGGVGSGVVEPPRPPRDNMERRIFRWGKRSESASSPQLSATDLHRQNKQKAATDLHEQDGSIGELLLGPQLSYSEEEDGWNALNTWNDPEIHNSIEEGAWSGPDSFERNEDRLWSDSDDSYDNGDAWSANTQKEGSELWESPNNAAPVVSDWRSTEKKRSELYAGPPESAETASDWEWVSGAKRSAPLSPLRSSSLSAATHRSAVLSWLSRDLHRLLALHHSHQGALYHVQPVRKRPAINMDVYQSRIFKWGKRAMAESEGLTEGATGATGEGQSGGERGLQQGLQRGLNKRGDEEYRRIFMWG